MGLYYPYSIFKEPICLLILLYLHKPRNPRVFARHLRFAAGMSQNQRLTEIQRLAGTVMFHLADRSFI
jgi:hypothetical protein